MNCDEAELLLHALIDGELDAGHARDVENHVAGCPRCAAALQDYGVPLRDELMIEGDYVFDDGFRGARRLLDLAEPPTATAARSAEAARLADGIAARS